MADLIVTLFSELIIGIFLLVGFIALTVLCNRVAILPCMIMATISIWLFNSVAAGLILILLLVIQINGMMNKDKSAMENLKAFWSWTPAWMKRE